ncbi:hypothetical protein K440DRAFT_664469 [Wilcoxina mikolae CBS 423.85]|nr:hypothetical protein K440DRAFT_664469 [Wilcoxina mikolae CBS 423.85]
MPVTFVQQIHRDPRNYLIALCSLSITPDYITIEVNPQNPAMGGTSPLPRSPVLPLTVTAKMVYQASRDSLFAEVSKHFCEYCNLGRGTVRFLCDGSRVEDGHTIAKIMEYGDVDEADDGSERIIIEAFMQQVGGG